MSKLSTQPYKGTRDYYPEDMRLRNWIFETWRRVCQSFGYEEYDAPVLEPLELYTAKTSEEIVNEQTYSFTDRGGRKVVMRPEMTPSVSRMVAARRQELSYPLRLFSIPNCFRYERPQRGRTREFWQLNADLFGIEGIEGDVEIILLADSVMRAFAAKPDQYEIQINSRKLFEEVFDDMDLDKATRIRAMGLIDKKEKVESNEWEKLFDDLLGRAKAARLLDFLADEAVPKEAQTVIEQLKQQGVTNVRFNRYLARGFEYYTDIVFEVFDANPENNRSMFGGGRYDGLIGEFGVEPVATVGFGMGDATLVNFLKSNGLLAELETETDIYVAVIGEAAEGAQEIAQKLRSQGQNVAVDFSGRKLDKKIKTAEKKGIKKLVVIGEEELKSGQLKVKDLETGKQSLIPLQ